MPRGPLTLDTTAEAADLDAAGVVVERAETAERTVLDTFDCRVHRAGGWLVLDRDSRATHLRWLEGGQEVEACRLRRAPGRALDLPPSTLRDRLVELTEPRALLPLATVRLRRHHARLLDEHQKTVARATLEAHELIHPGPAREVGRQLLVEPLRGYGGEARALLDRLAPTLGLGPAGTDPVAVALGAAGLAPGGYTGKLDVALEPDLPAAVAWSHLLAHLLEVLQANDDGVRRDLDPEFLHDHRVAARRARSLLAAACGVLEEGARTRLRAELAWLGTLTGPVRDLDVFLLQLPELRAALHPSTAADLDPFEEHLVAEQRRRHRRLVTSLDSPRFAELLAAWRELAEPERAPWGEEGRVRAEVVARQRTWDAYRKVARDGRRIDDDAPDEALHDLRKRAKRLRYLLEGFASLWPGDEVRRCVAELKRLQDNLGEVQDTVVHAVELRDLARDLAAAGRGGPDTFVAMGVAAGHLLQRREVARAEFAERFERFDRPSVRRRYRALLHPDEGPGPG